MGRDGSFSKMPSTTSVTPGMVGMRGGRLMPLFFFLPGVSGSKPGDCVMNAFEDFVDRLRNARDGRDDGR